MRHVTTIILTALCACSSPSVSVWGGQSQDVTVGEFRFRVNYTVHQAEAYRTNMMVRPAAREIFPAAAVAMEQASGCRVLASSLTGDVALIKGDLIC